MARSRRHTPIASITTAASEKQDKRQANRIHRSVARTIVKRDTDPDATVLPIMREVSDEWGEHQEVWGARDGEVQSSIH